MGKGKKGGRETSTFVAHVDIAAAGKSPVEITEPEVISRVLDDVEPALEIIDKALLSVQELIYKYPDSDLAKEFGEWLPERYDLESHRNRPNTFKSFDILSNGYLSLAANFGLNIKADRKMLSSVKEVMEKVNELGEDMFVDVNSHTKDGKSLPDGRLVERLIEGRGDVKKACEIVSSALDDLEANTKQIKAYAKSMVSHKDTGSPSM